MPKLLYRLGRFFYRRSWRVIGVWLMPLVGVLGGGIALGGQTQNSDAIPGTESQNALDRLSAIFPSVAGATAQAAVEVPAGSKIADAKYGAAITQLNAKITKISGVDTVIGPFSQYATGSVSSDKQYARSQVQLKGTVATVKPATLTELKATAKIGEDAGMTVAFGAQVLPDHSFGITTTELFGVIFAGIVLIITVGSLLAADMPLVSALVGVGIVIEAITELTAFTTVSSSAPSSR